MALQFTIGHNIGPPLVQIPQDHTLDIILGSMFPLLQTSLQFERLSLGCLTPYSTISPDLDDLSVTPPLGFLNCSDGWCCYFVYHYRTIVHAKLVQTTQKPTNTESVFVSTIQESIQLELLHAFDKESTISKDFEKYLQETLV